MLPGDHPGGGRVAGHGVVIPGVTQAVTILAGVVPATREHAGCQDSRAGHTQSGMSQHWSILSGSSADDARPPGEQQCPHWAQAVQASFLHHPLASASVGSGSETEECRGLLAAAITFPSCLWNSTALLAPPAALRDFLCPRQTPATWGIQAPVAVLSWLAAPYWGWFCSPMSLVTFRQEKLLSSRLPMPKWLPTSRGRDAWLRIPLTDCSCSSLGEWKHIHCSISSTLLSFSGSTKPLWPGGCSKLKKTVLKHFHRWSIHNHHPAPDPQWSSQDLFICKP